MREIRIALAQMDTRVGDIPGNARKIEDWICRAREAGADLVCFPELTLTGYPPEDLLLMPHFVERNLQALEQVARACAGICALVGFVDREDDIYNAAALIHDGRHVATYRKHYLPTYGVFDEDRYFQPGEMALVASLRGVRLGVTICEDLWYPMGPARVAALQGNAELLVNLSSSPYHVGKRAAKEQMLATRAADNRVFVAYVNRVGGQDELVFDGQSLLLSPEGDVLARGPAFAEALIIMDLEAAPLLRARLSDPRRRKEKIFESAQSLPLRSMVLEDLPARTQRAPVPTTLCPPPDPDEEILEALRLGTRCYVRNNGFREVAVGLSGGIDSALTAVVAAQALGAGAVVGVIMPSVYTSEQSVHDARALAGNLGIRSLEIPIQEIQEAYLNTLAQAFQGHGPDVTEENLQARIRGNLLMALSNKFGWLVLTTGNKSETSMGYCTLYGDMAGGFGVIKDVPKTWVYRLAGYVNRTAGTDLIPESILARPPTAELRPGQLDTDSLPPYETLDPILQAYVEEEMSPDEIAELGFHRPTVVQVLRSVDRSEYKRRQSPPGIKITARAFGKERRLPITNQYRVE